MAKAPKTISDGEKKRVEKALSRVGLSPDMFPGAAVDAVEKASVHYEAATMDADRDYWRAEVMRFAATLLA